jgi:BMFP domain-containing protein YqiC
MQDKNLLNDLSDKLASLLPKAEALGSEVKDELQSKIHGQLKSSLASLDVVSREEFDAQVAALARAEAKIAELEQRLTALAGEQD